MEIEVKDLKIGDEIIVLGQVPKYLTIVEDPVIGLPSKWSPHRINYKTIRCRNNVQIVATSSQIWSQAQRVYLPGTRMIKTNILEPCKVGEGETKKINLNYKRLWRVNY